MKKIVFILLLSFVLMVLLSSMAFAAAPKAPLDVGDAAADDVDVVQPVADVGEPDPGGGDVFYTWAMLATYAGCLLATLAATQFFKRFWPMAVPVEFLSYIIALVILLLANYFMGSFSLETASISIFNAVVVALSANGGYNGIKKVATSSVVKQE